MYLTYEEAIAGGLNLPVALMLTDNCILATKVAARRPRINRIYERARNLLTYVPQFDETTAIGSCGSDYAIAAAKAL